MKKNVFVMLLLGIFMTCSCSNEAEIMDDNSNSETIPNQEILKKQSMAKIVAEIVSGNSELVQEIKVGVDKNLAFGQDEAYRFTDILEPKQSKLLKYSNPGKFANALIKVLKNTSNGNLKSSGNELYSFLLRDNVQIYWPYSENWDGSSIPTIAYDSEDSKNPVYAYRFTDNGIMDSIPIDEEYAMQNPVWIININETDYKDLPDFEGGQSVKNGIHYVPREVNSDHKINATNRIRTSTEESKGKVYAYDWILQSMYVTQQHDDWANGGSEFIISCATPKDGYTQFQLNFSRSDISYRRYRNVFQSLNTDWTQDQLTNAFQIVESDGGGSRYFEAKLELLDMNIINAKLPFGSKDDIIVQRTYSRSYIFSSANEWVNGDISKGHVFYENGGVHYSMPVYWR